MSPSVRRLDEASQTVRLLFGSSEEGIRNGNIAKPTDRTVSLTAAELATNASHGRPRRARNAHASAATIATTPIAIAQRPSGPLANHDPPIDTALPSGCEGRSVAGGESRRKPGRFASHSPASA